MFIMAVHYGDFLSLYMGVYPWGFFYSFVEYWGIQLM
ncbi:hypothetical protein AMTRI_Chr09g38920 [Amborella trichopoda]